MKIVVALLTALIATSAQAHGPTPRKTDESVLIKASPESIWKKITAPCSIASWHPEVAACEIITDKQHKITLKNGKSIIEEIDEMADTDMTLSYRLTGEIDMAALPVSSLNGRIRLKAEDGGVRVSWMARYYRAFTGNEPPEGQDDEAAQVAIDTFVKTGLANLGNPAK
ncbi:MAG: SRPBCC family protein [Candidatus Methylopumilus sp.]|jgi:mxaD protein